MLVDRRSLPALHRVFLNRALPTLTSQRWLVGIAASGSFATDTMDEFSDLDLTLAVEDDHYDDVLNSRTEIAKTLGHLLTAFIGEHVGEPRLLLCLYGPPLLHVDFVFTTLSGTVRRVDEPVVLWERGERLTQVLQHSEPVSYNVDHQWIEDRIWVWVHKAASKIGRGELFEVIEYLAFLRKRILGPLCLEEAGQKPSGLREVERAASQRSEELRATVGSHEARECLLALRATVGLYQSLRRSGIERRDEAEAAVEKYLVDLESRLNRV